MSFRKNKSSKAMHAKHKMPKDRPMTSKATKQLTAIPRKLKVLEVVINNQRAVTRFSGLHTNRLLSGNEDNETGGFDAHEAGAMAFDLAKEARFLEDEINELKEATRKHEDKMKYLVARRKRMTDCLSQLEALVRN